MIGVTREAARNVCLYRSLIFGQRETLMRYQLRTLRWLAIVPAAPGLYGVLMGLLWTSLAVFFWGIGLLLVALVIWRGFAGEWPLISGGRPQSLDPSAH